MATIRASLSHEERTAQEPRRSRLEPVILSQIHPVNNTIRLLRLSAKDPNHTLKFLPGQWLDTFIPGLRKAGGFTITSTPREGRPTTDRPAYFELAIQNSENPPAKWLWKPEDEILGSELVVRVGGSFHWPPLGLDTSELDQVVLVAGGVGINPLISIFAHLLQRERRPSSIRFLYATKVETGPVDGERILFLDRLMALIKNAGDPRIRLDLFLTGTSEDKLAAGKNLPAQNTRVGRITHADLESSLGSDATGRKHTVCFICGPPGMTDEMVNFLGSREGMARDRVLCEKWW